MLRLLDIPADRGLGFGVFDHGGETGDAGALARAIKIGASAAYGTAGPELVRRIIRGNVKGTDVRAMVADFVKSECPPKADGQIERAAQRLGLIAAAGELAISLDVALAPGGRAQGGGLGVQGLAGQSRGLGTGRSGASPRPGAALHCTARR